MRNSSLRCRHSKARPSSPADASFTKAAEAIEPIVRSSFLDIHADLPRITARDRVCGCGPADCRCACETDSHDPLTKDRPAVGRHLGDRLDRLTSRDQSQCICFRVHLVNANRIRDSRTGRWETRSFTTRLPTHQRIAQRIRNISVAPVSFRLTRCLRCRRPA